MMKNPIHWQSHYRGAPPEQALARRYSLSDRMRYYWPLDAVQKSLHRLFANLGAHPAPAGLLSQYAPDQYEAIRQNEITPDPLQIVHHKIRQVIKKYVRAAGMDRP